MLTVGSLFSGIGGLDLGLERAGMSVQWQVEIDEYCNKVLAKHWPNVVRHRDVRSVGSRNLTPVDVICGGFPCQDISVAGNGAGLDGDRSGLWFEYARIIGELRPSYVIVENVTALIGRGLDRVLGDLAELRYDAEWQVVPACAFGAAHHRERLFLLAYPHRVGLERHGTQPIFRKPDISSGPHSRGGQDWRKRSDIFTPKLCRSPHGISAGLDRIKSIGNAVVPQVAQYVGECVVAHAQSQQEAA